MTPVVTQLLLANVLAMLLLGNAGNAGSLYTQLWFIPALVLERPWTLITYMFLHGGTTHLLFNMLGLFFLGPRLEARLGSGHFLGLYIASGVVGALASFGSPYTPIVGASGGVFGVMYGYARIWPRDRLLIWGIIPIEARILVLFLTAMSLVSGLSGARDGIAHFAHLGGFVGAWIYLKLRERNSDARRFQRKVENPAVRMADRSLRTQLETIRPETLHEVNREEYERIAAKVASEGLGALTERERVFIQRFSSG